MNGISIKGRKIVGGKAEGYALVSKERICFLATIGTDGLVTEKRHSLYGTNVAGKILVFPSGRGSTSGSYRLYEMALCGTAPRAILNVKADPVTVSGALLGKIPMLHQFEVDPTEVIRTGDYVVVDADAGIVNVKR